MNKNIPNFLTNIDPGRSGIMKAILVVALPAAWPFINFVNVNRHEFFSHTRLLAYGLGSVAIACIGLIVFRALFAKNFDWRRSSSFVAVCVICFFCFSITFSIADSLWQSSYLKTWLVFSAIIIVPSWYLSRLPSFQNLLLVMGSILIAVPATEYVAYKIQVATSPTVQSDTDRQEPVHKLENALPSVYHIILDEYGRSDTLRELYDFDNSEFLDELAQRGFFVADEAMSNYESTASSVPSTMAMEYLFQGKAGPAVLEKSKQHLSGGGPVFDWFNDAGFYRALLRYNGAYCTKGRLDYCFPAGLGMFGDLEREIIRLTPFNKISSYLISTFEFFEPKFYELGDVRAFIEKYQGGQSVFAHIHMLIPHRPYRFTETCEKMSIARQNQITDFVAAYSNQIRCANRMSLDLIDTIVKRNPDAIIILQSDHGPRLNVGSSDWRENDKWWYNFGVLNAWRFGPESGCRQHLHPKLTLVNTFRIAIACLTGEKPELEPERWFYTHENEFLEILSKNSS